MSCLMTAFILTLTPTVTKTQPQFLRPIADGSLIDSQCSRHISRGLAAINTFTQFAGPLMAIARSPSSSFVQ
ncbi:uncharacterized protein METZ01_LOCUS389387 [marine metagenome]|uniref:Uncharacterized protein n=1 Tax=marine metagenome TaxID=408172 RepID=A0A382UQJ1_9ZZZZ